MLQWRSGTLAAAVKSACLLLYVAAGSSLLSLASPLSHDRNGRYWCKCGNRQLVHLYAGSHLSAFMISADQSLPFSSDLCTIGAVGGRCQGTDTYLQAGTGQLYRAGCDVFADSMAKAQGKEACMNSN